MDKRRLCIYLGSVGLVVVGLVILFGFAITELRKHPPLWYYINLATSPRELPTRLISPAFQYVTDRELPQKAESLRAIFVGGRDPSIFVRFETDSEGIAYILEKFSGRDVKTSTFDADSKRRHSVLRVHGMLSYYQEKTGIHIFDWKEVKSGLELKYSAGIQPSYEIVIDKQQNSVYVFAYWQ